VTTYSLQLVGCFKSGLIDFRLSVFAKNLQWLLLSLNYYLFRSFTYQVYFLVSIYGLEGIVMAHALTYFVYLLVLVVYFRKSLF
jgi:PST family polysaccharide transporter